MSIGNTRFRASRVYARDFGLIDANGNLLPFYMPHATGNMVFNVRKRFTTAQVNSGAVVIEGVAGAKIRLVDLVLATEGGAPDAEDITIESEQGSTSAVLATFAHTDLGDNDYAHLFDGETTLLNEGASLVSNDEGKDVTVESEGVTTVDHIDIIATYVLEPA